MASDAWEIHVFEWLAGGGSACLDCGGGERFTGSGVDGCVAHCGFEVVVWMAGV